jgi:cytochrome o ubiquinol oxidase operon protein cyoD
MTLFDPTQEEAQYETLRPYLIGFLSSIVLTLTSFVIVTKKLLPASAIFLTIIGLAVLQATLQLNLFLHLGKESKPRWKMMTFLFMALVLTIIFFGTLWIITNLNSNVMPPMRHQP